MDSRPVGSCEDKHSDRAATHLGKACGWTQDSDSLQVAASPAIQIRQTEWIAHLAEHLTKQGPHPPPKEYFPACFTSKIWNFDSTKCFKQTGVPSHSSKPGFPVFSERDPYPATGPPRWGIVARQIRAL